MTTSTMTRKKTAAKRPTPMLASDLLELIDRSRDSLLEACHAKTATERYAAAHLGALRACAAVLAQVAPRAVGSRPRNAWASLRQSVAELAEWADFFEASGQRARAAQSGLVRVSPREADDLVRQSEMFLDAVLIKVGLPPVPTLTANIAPVAYR